MATAPLFLTSSDAASSSDPPSSKRLLVPSANGEGEGQMSKEKKARTSDAPPPSFPDATLVPINSLKAQTWTKEDLGKQFIRGEIAQVSKWKEETQMAKIWLKDSESGIVLEFKGAWARTVVLPNTSSKLTVSLEGAVLEEKEGAPAVVGAVFAGGVKMKWSKESVDGFQLKRTLSDASATSTVSGSSSLGDIEAIMVARSFSEAPPPVDASTSSSSSKPLSNPLPPLQQAAPSPSTSSLLPVKRPHPPSPEAGPSSKRPTIESSHVLLPPNSTSPSSTTTPISKLLQPNSTISTPFPSSSSSGSSKIRNLVLAKVRVADPNLDEDLLSKVVDAIMHAPMDVLMKCVFDAKLLGEQMEMARMFIEFEEDGDKEFSSDAKDGRLGEVEVEPPVVRVDEPPVEEAKASRIGSGAAESNTAEVPNQPVSPPAANPLPPPLTSNDATSSNPSPPSAPSRLSPQSPSKPSPSPSSNLPSASAASSTFNLSLSISASSSSTSSTSTTSTNGTKLNKAQKKAEKKRLAAAGAGGVGGAAGGSRGPGGSGSSANSNEGAGAKRSRMAIENGEFELGLKTKDYTYSDLATLRAFPTGPTFRHTIGVVTNIQPLKVSKSGQSFITLRIDDPSGYISVKMFAKEAANLPVEPKLQIGSVLLLRHFKRAEFQGTPDFNGNSYDGYAWAFVDTDLTNFEHQPLRPKTKDLESLATLGPLVEAYFRKLAAWSKKKFELVKDEDEVVTFANESVAVKSKGRRTLRMEEIKEEREFFDCIGQVVKIEFTDFAKDFWITDWTSNEFFEDYGPSTTYDATPTEPFGTSCFKISAWNDLTEEITSSLRVGKIVRLKNVKPRVKNFWEGSMFDSDGCQIERVAKTPELDALLDRRAKFITKLRADTTDSPLPALASMVQVVARSNSAGRQTLPIEDLQMDNYYNLVCQIVSLQYLNTANSTALEVTDFSENRQISPSSQPRPLSNPPRTRFGRFVLQVTLWEDEGRGSTVKNLVTGDFVKIENISVRLHNGRMLAHVNPRKTASIIPTVTRLHEEDDALIGLLSRRHFFFDAAKKDDLEAYRPPPRAPLVRPPAVAVAPPRVDETRRIRDFVVGDVVDCIVQLVRIRSIGEPTVLHVTDFTSNPFIPMGERTRASTDSVYPKESFGRCVLTVWIEASLGLERSFFDELVEGKLLLIRGMRIRSQSKSLLGLVGGGEGVSVTRVQESDSSAMSFLQLRRSYYNSHDAPLVVAAPSRQAWSSTIPRVSPPAPQAVVPSISSDPIQAPRVVKPEPKEVPVAREEPVAGPSLLPFPVPSPAATFVPEKSSSPTTSSEAMIALPSDASPPTQTSFLDPDHPNGSSLLDISTSDRPEFRTRAAIMNFFPNSLEEIVISTCEICDRCLLPDETICTCPRASEEFVSQDYRLLLCLRDGTKETFAALCGDEMLALFPELPPASQFADDFPRLQEYLGSKIKIITSHLSSSISGRAPLLDLGLRRKVVRVDGVEKIFCSIFATTFRDAA